MSIVSFTETLNLPILQVMASPTPTVHPFISIKAIRYYYNITYYLLKTSLIILLMTLSHLQVATLPFHLKTNI